MIDQTIIIKIANELPKEFVWLSYDMENFYVFYPHKPELNALNCWECGFNRGIKYNDLSAFFQLPIIDYNISEPFLINIRTLDFENNNSIGVDE